MSLLLMLGICGHTFGWPRRREDGQDWQTCRKCGTERVSPIQFQVKSGYSFLLPALAVPHTTTKRKRTILTSITRHAALFIMAAIGTALVANAEPINDNATVTGWVLERDIPPQPTYTTPDPDYEHFSTFTVNPLFTFDVFVMSNGWPTLYVPFTTFDCHCTDLNSYFNPPHEGGGGGDSEGWSHGGTPTPTPEPTTAGSTLGGGLILLALGYFKLK